MSSTKVAQMDANTLNKNTFILMRKLFTIVCLSAFSVAFAQSKDYYFQNLKNQVLLTNSHENNKYSPDNVVLYGKCIKYSFGYNFNTMAIFNPDIKSNPWDNSDEMTQKIANQCGLFPLIGDRFLPQQINMEADYSDLILNAITTDIKDNKNFIPKEYVTEIARCLKDKYGTLYKNMYIVTKKASLLNNQTNFKDCGYILNIKP